MAFLKSVLCCCATDDDSHSCTDRTMKMRLKEHKYCGCTESSKQRTKMQTCDIDVEDDKLSLVDNEAVEAVELDRRNTCDDPKECSLEKPTVPFIYDLTSALHPQADIVIQGLVTDNAIRFSINLAIGRNAQPDLAFHFNPRMDQLYTARNSRLNGSWGHEEGNSQHRFPFSRGQPFHIQLFLTHSEFLVAVNGSHYCSFTYRTSLLCISRVQIEGGVKLSRVHLHTSTHYPSPLPEDCPPCPYMFVLKENATTYNPTQITPVYGLLRGKLKSNSEIEIHGRVKLLPYAFFINLQEGSDIWPHPEIPLHVSVRFSQGGDHVILANTWLSPHGWGHEEFTHTKCLFTPGHQFRLRISCLDDAFVARVDDQLLLAFKHRVPFSNIDTLHIQGDVHIYHLSVHTT